MKNLYNELFKLIKENQTYFGDGDPLEIACDIVAKYANDKPFIFKNTPPVWLDAELEKTLASIFL